MSSAAFLQELDEFYSCCELCGRCGSDLVNDPDDPWPECAACEPVRRRVNRREAGWILHYAMVRAGRLPDTYGNMLKRQRSRWKTGRR